MSTDPNRQGASQPEKSAAERARELLAANDNSLEATLRFGQLMMLHAPRILDDLSAATERAEKAEKEAARQQGLAESWSAGLIAQANESLAERDKLREDLATSRAAHDKTAIERDKLHGWVMLARPVVEAVRSWQSTRTVFDVAVEAQPRPDNYLSIANEYDRATDEVLTRLFALPLPQKETT